MVCYNFVIIMLKFDVKQGIIFRGFTPADDRKNTGEPQSKQEICRGLI